MRWLSHWAVRVGLMLAVVAAPLTVPPAPATAAPAKDTPTTKTQTRPVSAKVRPVHFPLRAGQQSTVSVRSKAPGTPRPVQKGARPAKGAIADPAASAAPPARVAAAHTGAAFEGMNKGDNPTDIDPPDSQIAAGPQHLVEFMNVTGRIYDKAGKALDTFDLGEFFLTPQDFSVTSPQVAYDPLSGRFFAAAVAERLTSPAAGLEMLAVSDTSDPTAGWLVYHTESVGVFPDSPTLGIGDDKVVVNSNAFPTPSGGYLGAQTRVYQKSDLLAGHTVTISSFAPAAEHFSLQPAHAGPNSKGVLWMAAVDFHEQGAPITTLKVFALSGTPDANNVGRVMTALTIPGVTSPPNAVQRGDAKTLYTGDNRLLDAAYHQGALFLVGHTGCEFDSSPSITESCLQVMKVDVKGTTPALTFSSTYGAPDTYYFYPAITVDASGNAYVVFGRSSATEYPSLRHTGLQPSDSGLQASLELRAGESAFTGNRWGSYFGAAPDPVGPNCVWVVGEYARSGAVDDEWGQYIGRLNFAGQCAAATASLVDDFESGNAARWELGGENDGYAEVVQEGECFSANNSLGVQLNGNYALNVRSAVSARTNSVGVATSPAFTLGRAVAFRGLSENDDAAPVEDPVTLEVRILDAAGKVLHSQVVKTNVVTLSPGTSRQGCLIGELRNGDFSLHAVDTSAFEGKQGRVEFRQHTNRRGKGFFTLIDDVAVIGGSGAAGR